ncbi:MAG TPA: type II toxin-antitoxin system RelE/ParE family toxin [Burkholderiales bacterium]|jgi:plasmid stabilization system protein ParE|nr:type II toxin-antitoxin system RelE/ParE family toxin [Burkholderiales bacterium]
MKLEFHPQAEEEFLEAVSYYEVRMPGLGERFAAEVRTAGALLLEYPEIGQAMSQELRKLVLDRFPYYLIYNISFETVYIVAVAHERRKPGYWETR